MVIILVAQQTSDPMSNRIYLYRHKKNLLAFGECVGVGMECYKLPLYPYQNIVCKKFDSGIDHCSTVWIMRLNTQQQDTPMKRSQVYFNLHKRCFSVQQGGKVYAHAEGVMMKNVRFNVSKAGQRKVRETGRKNVHARVTGYGAVYDESKEHLPVVLDDGVVSHLREYIESLSEKYSRATYNPYKNDTFVDAVTGEALHDASKVLMFTREGAGPVILYKRTLSD